MRHLGRIGVALVALVVLVPMAPARAADAADDACRQMASDPNAEPTLYAALCKDPAGLSQVCLNQVKQMGLSSPQNTLIRHFIVPSATCKDKKSVQALCAFVQSFDGYEVLGQDGALVPDPSDPDYATLSKWRERTVQLCGTTRAAIRASLCPKADAARKWEFAIAECPSEGKAIYLRECVKPTITDGEGAGRVVIRTAAECAQSYEVQKKRPR